MIRKIADFKLEPAEQPEPEKRWCEYCGREEYKEDMVWQREHWYCSYACRDAAAAEAADGEAVKKYARENGNGLLYFLGRNPELLLDEMNGTEPVGRTFERWAREFCKQSDGFFEWLEQEEARYDA